MNPTLKIWLIAFAIVLGASLCAGTIIWNDQRGQDRMKAQCVERGGQVVPVHGGRSGGEWVCF